MICYLDASAVLRCLLAEPGARAPLGRGSVSSRIVRVEVARAVDRFRVLGALDLAGVSGKLAEADLILAAFNLVDVSEAVLARASVAFPVAVRALDAIHVATAEALGLRDALEFWTHDVRQAQAARSRGLDVRGV